jgi:hypothetical protein
VQNLKPCKHNVREWSWKEKKFSDYNYIMFQGQKQMYCDGP